MCVCVCVGVCMCVYEPERNAFDDYLQRAGYFLGVILQIYLINS
jgi:hypothetical protein